LYTGGAAATPDELDAAGLEEDLTFFDDDVTSSAARFLPLFCRGAMEKGGRGEESGRETGRRWLEVDFKKRQTALENRRSDGSCASLRNNGHARRVVVPPLIAAYQGVIEAQSSILIVKE
jgi:hypothetical protein